MAHVVRKISRAKWEPREELGSDAISADAVTSDLRTSGNRLSFWECADPENESELRQVILALAGAFDRIDKIDVVWIKRDAAEEKGIVFKECKGRTRVADLQERHLDAIRLELNKLNVLAKLLASAVRIDKNCRRYTKNQVVEIIAEATRKGRISPDQLPPAIRKRVCSKGLNK